MEMGPQHDQVYECWKIDVICSTLGWSLVRSLAYLVPGTKL
jgi:hypothetical protein